MPASSGATGASRMRLARKIVAVALVGAAGMMIGHVANNGVPVVRQQMRDIDFDCKFIDDQYYCAASATEFIINP